ncbi:MAG: NAD-dependent epimerase/dehydratase family protein, partial [Myxococcales bacterium]
MITRRNLLSSLVGGAAAATFARVAFAGPQPQPRSQDDDLASAKAAKGPKARRAAKPLRILLLGGTGFLGPHLVENARARGHTVTLFNRGKTHPELFPEVEKLRGDRNGQLAALEGRSWDAVVDTSGYVPRIVKMSAELLAKQVRQYVFISSISVFPDDVKPGADESTPVQQLAEPGSEEVRKHYGALKALCEHAAEAAMPGRTTNVRPGLIVGPGDPTDRYTYWPVRIDRGGEALAPGT